MYVALVLDRPFKLLKGYGHVSRPFLVQQLVVKLGIGVQKLQQTQESLVLLSDATDTGGVTKCCCLMQQM